MSSLETLYSGQFTFSIQFRKPNYLVIMTGRKNAWTVSTSRCPIQSLRKLFLGFVWNNGRYLQCMHYPSCHAPTSAIPQFLYKLASALNSTPSSHARDDNIYTPICKLDFHSRVYQRFGACVCVCVWRRVRRRGMSEREYAPDEGFDDGGREVGRILNPSF